MHHRTQRGFTLVELSIVLVIVGLIVAGVLMGRDMVESARRRKTIQQFDTYRAAVNAFRDKYRFYPGDLPYPENYFDLSNTHAAYKGVQTYGNGLVTYYKDSVMAWIELNKSGILLLSVPDGPTAYPAFSNVVCGTNMPASQYPGACFQITENFHDINGTYNQNWLTVGGERQDGSWLYYAEAPSIQPTVAAWIDQKIDDGKPGAGRFITSVGQGNDPFIIQTQAGYAGSGVCTSGGNSGFAYPDPYITYRENVTQTTCRMALHLD